jgi:hypothetical protein
LNNSPSYIRIYVNQLSHLSLSSIARATIEHWHGGTIHINARGASVIDGEITVQNAKIELDGTARSRLDGQTGELFLETHGASKFEGKNLQSANSVVETDGASHAIVWVTGQIEGNAQGASSIEVKGNPSNSNIKTSGVARYQKL